MSAQHPHRAFGLFIIGALILLGGGALILAWPTGSLARPSGASLVAATGLGGHRAAISDPGARAPLQGTPTPTPANLPDLVPQINWACIPLRVQLTTRCANCAALQIGAGPSTMRFENHNGDHVDIPVPALTALMPEYTYDCVFGSCVPNAWLSALPYTLTVDIFNDVPESDETNNVAVLNSAPPPCPAITPTVTPTPAGATPTPTGAPPTGTNTPLRSPTPSPTMCSIQFTDVSPNDPFYTYIRCLACRNIISGYSASPPCAVAPCFLLGAAVTRGQIAKIIANAADFVDFIPSTQHTFTDVPYSNPFWLYIERAALHNIISGYSTSPPCTTGVPCFLPGNPVTRGQMAKIDTNAAGYSESIPSTQQTFTDVPNTDPFWVYIERANLHGVISGYSTNPPCPAPGVPSFCPGNLLTRGQGAKIVANTLYPNCQTPARH